MPKSSPDDIFEIQSNDKTLREIDNKLTSIFTDTGIARGASARINSISEHYQFKDGQLHTLHIYGDESATADAGVYLPKKFSDVKITSTDTVIAANPETKQVILIAHIQVGTSLKTLKENMKTVRENGTVFIGQIGGKGGAGDPTRNSRGKHSHLTIFPNEASRIGATNAKIAEQKKFGQTADYPSSASKNLGDFRKLIPDE